MLPEPLQYLMFVGFAALMFLLRLDARRFSAAEWDTEDGDWRVWLPRLSWYAGGVALGLIIFALHPSPVAELNLTLAPDRGGAMLLGLVYGGAGVIGAFVLAALIYGRFDFPRPGRYPGGVVFAIGTAFFDEFLFRGVLLGLLLVLGLPDWLAVGSAAFIYAGAVRAVTGSRGLPLLLNWMVIGVIGGVLVIMTGGIAAAFVGHAITRFSFFMTMATPRRAATEQIQPRYRGSGEGGAYIIRPHDPRRG